MRHGQLSRGLFYCIVLRRAKSMELSSFLNNSNYTILKTLGKLYEKLLEKFRGIKKLKKLL